MPVKVEEVRTYFDPTDKKHARIKALGASGKDYPLLEFHDSEKRLAIVDGRDVYLLDASVPQPAPFGEELPEYEQKLREQALKKLSFAERRSLGLKG